MSDRDLANFITHLDDQSELEEQQDDEAFLAELITNGDEPAGIDGGFDA